MRRNSSILQQKNKKSSLQRSHNSSIDEGDIWNRNYNWVTFFSKNILNMENQEISMFQQTVIFNENDCIFVQPLCDFFKINEQNQYRNIKKDPILQNQWTKKSDELLFGDNYPRFCLTKKGFIRWIQIINPNTINPNLYKQFISYQILVFDYIYGSTLEKEQAKVDYTRLRKLKRLYGIIGREIQKTQGNVTNYLDNTFIQHKLNFTPNKVIKTQ